MHFATDLWIKLIIENFLDGVIEKVQRADPQFLDSELGDGYQHRENWFLKLCFY